MEHLVIIADWSSERGRKPTPQENRCWLAWGTHDHRSEPIYCPTRLEAEALIAEIIGRHPGVRTTIGFDFAIGLPSHQSHHHPLPTGRGLCALYAELVTDDASGHNNRFEAAVELNRRISAETSAPGPFWGCPKESQTADLPMRNLHADAHGFDKLRACEITARKATHTKPKSAWQLAGIGSVGGQSLTGLPAVHRLLTHPEFADRARLWPFEPSTGRDDEISIAEIYPSMYPEQSPSYWYKDARQVVDTRDAILAMEDPTPTIDHAAAKTEGWIMGVPTQKGP